MITDKNILASKSTKGPWYYHKNPLMIDKFKSHNEGNPLDFDIYKYDENVFGNPIIASIHSRDHEVLHEENEANAYILSAAPEAIEFIADLLAIMDAENMTLGMLKREILKGETILKKAYQL